VRLRWLRRIQTTNFQWPGPTGDPTDSPASTNPIPREGLARTYRTTDQPRRSTTASRAELLSRIERRERSWEDRAEVLPILRR
jgi:hypothetical protein